MPHGGGGGSHSGGHSSSHSSSHGSSGSGSGSRISNTYFHGAHRYVYYYNNTPHVYYGTNRDNSSTMAIVILLFMGTIWTLIGTIFGFGMCKYSQGGPLPRDYDDKIVIEDTIGMIENEDELEDCLKDFLKETGICICVIANTPWDAEYGRDIEKQSFNAYVGRWDDESHWLIYYVGSDPDREGDWNWYLTCGDDCVRILDYGQEDSFSASLTRYFIANSRYTFDEAIIKAVGELEPSLKGGLFYRDNVNVNGEDVSGQPASLIWVLFPLVFAGIGVAMLVGGIVILCKPSKERKARAQAIETPDPTSPLQDARCMYCGGIYYIGTVINCPHCGASLPLASEVQRY